MPWWDAGDLATSTLLANEFETIRDEFINILCCGQLRLHPQSNGGPRRQLSDGDWNIFELCSHGHMNTSNAILAPRTVQVLERMPDTTSHRNGLVYFSVLHPHVHVSAHCGPTNSRIRIHLGLRVPEGSSMRVGYETRQWREGECLVFDDSWEHEVYNQSEFLRAVLLVDVWHPDLTSQERTALLFSEYEHPKHLDERRGWIRELDVDDSYSTRLSFCSQTGVEYVANMRASLQKGQALVRPTFPSLRVFAFESDDTTLLGVVPRCGTCDPDCCPQLWEWLASLMDRQPEKFLTQDVINLLHLGSGYWLSSPSNERTLRTFMQSSTVKSLTSLLDRLRAVGGISQLLRFAATEQQHIPFSLVACLSVIAIREISNREGGTAAPSWRSI